MKLKNKAGIEKNNFAELSGLWVGFVTALLVFLIFLIPTLNLFELVTLDYRFRSRLTPPVNPAIILIGIDDKSIEKVGRWPWPRSYHGQLISALKEAGAKVIGFDVLFTEPSDDSAEDQALTQAIAGSKNVFLPFYFKKLQTDVVNLPSGSQPVLPLPEMQKVAAGICPINRQGRMMVNFAGNYTCFTIYPYETVLLSYFQEKSGDKPTISLVPLSSVTSPQK